MKIIKRLFHTCLSDYITYARIEPRTISHYLSDHELVHDRKRMVRVKVNRNVSARFLLHLPFFIFNLTMFCISMLVPDLRFKISLISVGRMVFKSCKDSTKASKSIITLLKDFRKSSMRFINQNEIRRENKISEKCAVDSHVL